MGWVCATSDLKKEQITVITLLLRHFSSFSDKTYWIQSQPHKTRQVLHVLNYEGQSNENGSEAKIYYRTFLTPKVISKTVNTFIPLGDKTANPILAKACGLSTEPHLYLGTHVFVRCKPMSTNVSLQVSKNVKIAWGEGTLSLCLPESPPDVRTASKFRCHQLARRESHAWWLPLIIKHYDMKAYGGVDV
jgi:hypothetical protein